MAEAFIASPSDRDHQESDSEVTIILSPRNSVPDSPIEPERRLVLTRKAPSISVGRASKVPTKGFVAAKENAWFDSPVMSRQHAELIANFDTNPKSVSVQDVGSLHGTFHTPNDGTGQETRLKTKQPVTLANGDILRFGIDIFRSKETFPPCAVDFLMEEKMTSKPTKPTKGTFSVPDDIDEDEPDYMSEIDESDMVFEMQPDGKIILPHSLPPASSRATPRQTLSIDLTGEDVQFSAVRNKSDFVDLTSEPEQDSEPIIPPICPQTVQIGGASIELPQSNVQPLDRFFDTDYSSDREEAGFRVDYDEEDSDEEDYLRLSSSDHESQSSEDSEMSDESVTSEIDDEFSAADAHEDEGIRKTPSYENSESGSPKNSPGPSGPFASTSFSAASATSCAPQAREPSPSDAAMFKSRPPFNEPPSNSRAQALGEKTGKFAYFSARENNRAIVGYHEASVPVSAIRETLQSESDISRSSQNCCAEEGSKPESSLVRPELDAANRASSATQDSAWSASGERFINNPRTDELPSLSADRAQSPDLDMTSAYTFQQSKLATEAKARQNIRRLPIQDLLAQEPKDQVIELAQSSGSQLPPLSEVDSPTGAKRSFEEAFDGDDQSIEYHGEFSHKNANGRWKNLPAGTTEPLSSHHIQDDVSMQEPTGSIAQNSPTAQAESQEPILVPVQNTIVRPSKRLRLAKAAAYVSCAALGGAAAFSVLVSTAPF